MRTFGEINGVSPGDLFDDRAALAKAGVHPPLVAGISGGKHEGADSIVLSGGYEDDEDLGDTIIYTGAGGQKHNKQVSDQVLDGVNLALAKNKIENLPVRVTRGHKHKNALSPSQGYKYAGIYFVERYWYTEGLSGYKVWRYKLVAQDKALHNINIEEPPAEYTQTERKQSTLSRILRSQQRAKNVKSWHNHQCQVCGLAINTSAGLYAEACHIKPLGKPHNGPDIESNILCLCPNHHVMFDNGVFSINKNLELVGIKGKLRLTKKHFIDTSFIEYHLAHYYQKK